MGAIDDKQTSWIIMGVFNGIRIAQKILVRGHL